MSQCRMARFDQAPETRQIGSLKLAEHLLRLALLAPRTCLLGFAIGLSCAPRLGPSAAKDEAVRVAPLGEPLPSLPEIASSQPSANNAVSGLRELRVPGFQPALLFVPAGTAKRPLVLAAHGAGGSPEWECDYWRRLTFDRVFVLCLRGTPLGTYPGYFYRDHRALEKELVAAEAAARQGEPRIYQGSGLYAGFSQGSSMGSAMIARHAAAFPFLVLIEGFELWNVPRGREFEKNGGRRILFACGSKECASVARGSVRWLTTGGIDARLEYAPGEGHTPLGKVLTHIEASLPWLVGDDPSWH